MQDHIKGFPEDLDASDIEALEDYRNISIELPSDNTLIGTDDEVESEEQRRSIELSDESHDDEGADSQRPTYGDIS